MIAYDLHILMSLAVAECIVQGRQVEWVRSSDGRHRCNIARVRYMLEDALCQAVQARADVSCLPTPEQARFAAQF